MELYPSSEIFNATQSSHPSYLLSPDHRAALGVQELSSGPLPVYAHLTSSAVWSAAGHHWIPIHHQPSNLNSSCASVSSSPIPSRPQTSYEPRSEDGLEDANVSHLAHLKSDDPQPNTPDRANQSIAGNGRDDGRPQVDSLNPAFVLNHPTWSDSTTPTRLSDATESALERSDPPLTCTPPTLTLCSNSPGPIHRAVAAAAVQTPIGYHFTPNIRLSAECGVKSGESGSIIGLGHFRPAQLDAADGDEPFHNPEILGPHTGQTQLDDHQAAHCDLFGLSALNYPSDAYPFLDASITTPLVGIESQLSAGDHEPRSEPSDGDPPFTPEHLTVRNGALYFSSPGDPMQQFYGASYPNDPLTSPVPALLNQHRPSSCSSCSPTPSSPIQHEYSAGAIGGRPNLSDQSSNRSSSLQPLGVNPMSINPLNHSPELDHHYPQTSLLNSSLQQIRLHNEDDHWWSNPDPIHNISGQPMVETILSSMDLGMVLSDSSRVNAHNPIADAQHADEHSCNLDYGELQMKSTRVFANANFNSRAVSAPMIVDHQPSLAGVSPSALVPMPRGRRGPKAQSRQHRYSPLARAVSSGVHRPARSTSGTTNPSNRHFLLMGAADYKQLPTKRSRGRRPPITPELGLPIPDGNLTVGLQSVPGGQAFDPNLNPDSDVVKHCELTKTGKPKKIFICQVKDCGKCFKRSEHLKRHVRSIHTNDKPYTCPWLSCPKTFSRHDNLNQHLKVHRAEDGGERLTGVHIGSDGGLRSDVDEVFIDPACRGLKNVKLEILSP